MIENHFRIAVRVLLRNRLFSLAGVIALPATAFFFLDYVLDEYTAHMLIPWGDLLLALAGVIALALVMIGLQTLTVARANPAGVLKSE